MNTTNQRYHANDSIPAIRGAGARCRVCARIYDMSERVVGFCPEHDSNNASDEAVLGRLACEMQDFFYGLVLGRTHGLMPVRIPNFTPSEHWWWMTVNILTLQCENSLIDLWDWWKGWDTREDAQIITKASEIKFFPPSYWHHRHCVFLVVLRSGAEYIVDLTGVQFGPDWPLVCPSNEYAVRCMHQDQEVRSLTYYRIGTAHESWLNQWPRPF